MLAFTTVVAIIDSDVNRCIKFCSKTHKRKNAKTQKRKNAKTQKCKNWIEIDKNCSIFKNISQGRCSKNLFRYILYKVNHLKMSLSLE
jgi:hypothetical protein